MPSVAAKIQQEVTEKTEKEISALSVSSCSNPEGPQALPQIVPLFPGAKPAATPARAVERYTFGQPSRLTTAELRKLRLRQEEFARSLATRLSIYLRLDFSVQVVSAEMPFYPKFIEALPNPTHITIFKAEPLLGVGLLEISPKLALAITDRLCGGAGKSPVAASPPGIQQELTDKTEKEISVLSVSSCSNPRALSAIEVALIDQFNLLLLREWCHTVASLPDASPELLGSESNPRFLQTSPSDTSMFVLTLEVRVTDCSEKLHLGLPFEMLEPVIRRLNSATETKKAPAPKPAAVNWNPLLNSVQVPLSAAWASLEITARKLAHLQVGEVLPITSELVQRTEVRLANIPKFAGRLGKCGKTWAVELTESLKS